MTFSLINPGYSGDNAELSRKTTIFIGSYTLGLHFLATFYFLDVYRGNDSTWIFSPTFEYSSNSMRSIAFGLAIYSILFMIACLGLIRGVKTETRIYYFPWFILAFVEQSALMYHVILLYWRYSYDSTTIIGSSVLSICISLHWFFYMIVLKNYRFLKRVQSPYLIFPEGT